MVFNTMITREKYRKTKELQVMNDWYGYKKGVNLGGWLSQCCHEKNHYDSFIQEQDIEVIASWGADHVRLPLDYVLIQDEEGSFKTEGFSYIDRCIKWCEANGLNIILDLHKTKGFSFDTNEKQFGFFEQEELQNRFYTLWEKLATLYGKYKGMVAFELLNEITDIKYAELWNSIAMQAIRRIRTIATDTYILVGGVWNNSIEALEILDFPYDEKIVYNFHYYEPLVFTHQKAYWIDTMSPEFTIDYPASIQEYIKGSKENLPQDNITSLEQYDRPIMDYHFIKEKIMIAVNISKKRNVRIYCGEYGVINRVDPKKALRWYQDIHNIFETYQIGRAMWSYKEMDFGIIDESRSEIQSDLILLL